MGMCKGCGQIFKTEDMKYGFCIDCQNSESFKKEIELINSGQKIKEQMKDKKFFYIIVWIIVLPIIVFAIYHKAYLFALTIAIFPILGLINYLEDVYYNNKQMKDYENKKQNNKTKAIDFILKYYKHIYFGIILLIIFFPPHYTNYKYIKYEFIIGSMYPIHFSTFFAEIVGILVIGLAFYFLFIKNKEAK
ncbi:hypothetical protein ACOTWH_09235 [Aliarcobacter butzleri]